MVEGKSALSEVEDVSKSEHMGVQFAGEFLLGNSRSRGEGSHSAVTHLVV